MNTKRIVITGGPGTGKTAIIKELTKRNYTCLEEVSRQITIAARAKGITQLFKSDPLYFSELLLKERITQFEALKTDKPIVFYDRGIPDIIAYLDYAKIDYNTTFTTACKNYSYTSVFILPPWETIFKNDTERYESFTEAKKIQHYLINTYKSCGYSLIDVPCDTLSKRTDFILNQIQTCP